MTTYMEAKLIGYNAPTGVATNHTYQLEVRQGLFGKITVIPTYGHDFKPIAAQKHRYTSIGDFLANWEVIRVVDPLDIRMGGDDED